MSSDREERPLPDEMGADAEEDERRVWRGRGGCLNNSTVVMNEGKLERIAQVSPHERNQLKCNQESRTISAPLSSSLVLISSVDLL